MDPVTAVFLALGKLVDLQILLFAALPAASQQAEAQHLFETVKRWQDLVDRGAAKLGMGPLAEERRKAP